MEEASGSPNTYSALADYLKNRADLDAYSNFLQSPWLNKPFDHFLAELCRFDSPHASLFYGASASLRSLMSRVNDDDEIGKLIHSLVSHPYDQLQHRVVYLAPIIHQPLFGLSHISPVNNALSNVIKTIDKGMTIRPAFILDEHTNLYAFEKFGVPLMQYNIIRGSGKMPDIKQMIVSSDFYQKLVDIVSTPSEKVHEVSPVKARRQRRHFVDSILQEAPYFQRIILAIDDAGVLLAVAILDVWNRTNVPRHRGPPSIDLIDIARKDETALMKTSLSEKFNEISKEIKAEKVLEGIFDGKVMKSDLTAAGIISKLANRRDKSSLGEIHFTDGFIVKPDKLSDTLISMANLATHHLPLKEVYAIVEERNFMLQTQNLTPELPLTLGEIYLGNSEDLL